MTKPDAEQTNLDVAAQLDASASSTGAVSADQKFELMSAYLDDEVSDKERRLVEYWLANDPQLLSDYQQQLKLHGAIQTLGSDSL